MPSFYGCVLVGGCIAMVRKNGLERLHRQLPAGTRAELVEMDSPKLRPRGRGASLGGATEPATCRSDGIRDRR